MIDILLNISVVFHNFKSGSFSVICWCSGSVVECLTRDRGAAGSMLTGVTVLCPWARHINPSLALVQTRLTRPFIFERLLMRCKESNQTNKKASTFSRHFISFTWPRANLCPELWNGPPHLLSFWQNKKQHSNILQALLPIKLNNVQALLVSGL